VVPCPRCPLAVQCSLGQKTLCGSLQSALLTVENSHGSLEFAAGTGVLPALLLLHAQLGWYRRRPADVAYVPQLPLPGFFVVAPWL